MVIHEWRTDDDLARGEPVVSLLRAAGAPTEPGPQPGEAAALAAFRATEHTKRRFSMHSLTPVKAAIAAAVSGGVLLTGGVAAAATGTLPGAAQDTARDLLGHVGVSVPGADDHSAGHADQRGPAAPVAASEGASPDTQGKGGTISDLAKNTTSTGVDKGAEISTLASGGKSQAGQHGQTGDQSGQAADGQAHKPSTTPTQPSGDQNSDNGTAGQDTADQSSGGESSTGTDTATGAGQRP